jgi:carboxypeptidase Taq
VDTSCLEGEFDEAAQRRFGISVLEKIGYTADSFRLDPTAHPFCTSASTNDIRLTTRYAANDIRGALFGSMHECGHGLYENGFSPALERTPVCRGASLGFHESQSRLWENLVGRSREFWAHFYPLLQRTFPTPFATLDCETFYRAINKIAPSLIRVEADEATYNLHVILRFELEQAIMDRSLKLEDLPEAWNTRMRDYLGVEVPNDRLGVLQDVHWSSGLFGYFPTYSLGNIISCQIWERARVELPDLSDQFARGEFLTLREWLRRTIHVHGAKFLPSELLQKVVGGPLDVSPYLRYLTRKYTDIYGLA